MADVQIKTKRTILISIRDFIISNFLFGNESEMVGNSSSFMENGIVDSTGILELIEYIEETYSITVEDEELIPENLDSLDNVSSYIEKKMN